MGTLQLKVRMFDGFSLANATREISDDDNRSYKVWLLLAYMIYCRNRPVSQEELIHLLWGESEGSSNPTNALKTMFHRVRSLLDQLDCGAGHSLIIRRRGSYAWNPDCPLTLDADTFESLCKEGAAAAEEDTKLECYLQALALYRGSFLPKLATESWVVPVNAYFSGLYAQAVHDTVSLLEKHGRPEEVISLCRKAVEIEPYDEFLYLHLIRGLLDRGDQKDALSVYESMSDMMFSNLGVMPSDELKALYREAARTVNDREISPGIVREQLKESAGHSGALFCGYDFFKVIYHAEARGVARSGSNAHLGLLTVSGENGEELSRQSLDRCMENLQDLILDSLRKGDIVSRCSIFQFILLLPQASYESSCMVMERIYKAFRRQYPHSPAKLRYSVQPLDPNA